MGPIHIVPIILFAVKAATRHSRMEVRLREPFSSAHKRPCPHPPPQALSTYALKDTAPLLLPQSSTFLKMSSDGDARQSKPQPHVLTSVPASSLAFAPAAVLDAGTRGRVEEFGKRMRAEHALRSELAKVLAGWCLR
jgi:hypothetical protein